MNSLMGNMMITETIPTFAKAPAKAADERALAFLQIREVNDLHFQLSPAELIEHALRNGEGKLTNTGALMCPTGTFTGRSPKDRYIVKDALTAERVDWGDVNIPFDEARFDRLHRKMCHYAEYQKVYVRFARAGADPRYQLNLCILTTSA
ncbi:phosphoenolpyruvate carboxykinase (ATP), partial [Arsenicibacter rosenii]|uniref:phosphoenolpyruvate carboxykinase (ATP) n=1 Tax=Arsenicibacter rosenii TaxID=1750698 RepID=UPI001E639005